MKKIVAIVVAVILISFSVPCSANQALPEISAKACVLLEAETNTVLYSKRAHEKMAMASTTKVMTGYVALLYGNLNDMVTTSDEAYGVEGSSIYLEKNEKISLKDLLYGLMLRSGNDAAIAIACHIGGSVEGFVKLMNDTAEKMGLSNTHFMNPNGLPAEGHYTTAFDLAIICSNALRNEAFAKIVSTRYHRATTGEKNRTMMNKNKLLWEYEGALGIKTGYTTEAGKCLTFASNRNNMTVIGVVLQCPNMFPDAKTVMDFAYSNYEMYKLVAMGMTVVSASVSGAEGDKRVNLCAEHDIRVPVKKTEGDKLIPSIKVKENIKAPIKKNDVLGSVALYSGNRLVASCRLVAGETIDTPSYMYYLKYVFSKFF